MYTKYCVAVPTLKRNKPKVYISLKESKFACSTNSLGSFQLYDLVCAEKIIAKYMFLECGGACIYKKSKSQQARHTKKLCAGIQFFQPVKTTFMCTCGFYNRYEHV